MTNPHILALSPSIASAIERRDGDELARILAPFVHDPELDDVFAYVASSYPRLAMKPDTSIWPDSVGERCLVLATAEMRLPRTDQSLVNGTLPPTSWNWLASVREAFSAEGISELPALKRALERGDVDQAARILDSWPHDTARRGRQTLLMTMVLLDRGSPEARTRTEALLLHAVERGEPDIPAPVVAMIAVLRVKHREPPPLALAERLAALPEGPSRDLSVAAALVGWMETGPLSPSYPNRITVDIAARKSTLGEDTSAVAWVRLLRRMLNSEPAAVHSLLGAQGALEPSYPEAIRFLHNFAVAASTTTRPVARRIANVQLIRLRRRDLAVPGDDRNASLAATLMPANVLAAIEQEPDASERRSRLIAKADAATVGVPIVLGEPAGSRIAPERISVCVVNHNQAMATIRLLTSLRRTWPSLAGEVLLLDNGSEAAEFQALSTFAAQQCAGPIRLLRSETNLGVGPARNLLFAAATADWILTLDNDMIMVGNPDAHLLPMVNESRASFFNLAYEELDHPGLAGVGKSWSIQPDGAGGQLFSTAFAAWFTRETPPRSVTSNRLSSGAALINRTAWQRVGPFSENHVVGYEDYEFSLRLSELGEIIQTSSVPLMVHGHLSPSRATDLSAVTSRFDNQTLEASSAAFEKALQRRVGANLGARGARSEPYRVVPRRLDLRHLDGPKFFDPIQPGAATIAFLREGILFRVVPALLGWLASHEVNIEIRDLAEFVEPEQALLVLQACRLIVGGPSMARLVQSRCRDLGLQWTGTSTAPQLVVLDPARDAPGQDMVYPDGPRMEIVRDGEHLIAAMARALGQP